MPKVDKIDAFSLVVRAMDRGDKEKAAKMMRVISESIQNEEKQGKIVSRLIEINGEEEWKLFHELLK